MKQLMLLTFLITAITNPSYAQDVISIEKGTPAPFTGKLFSDPKAIEIKNELIEKDYQDKIIQSLQRSVELFKSNENYYSQQKTLLDEQNQYLAKELYAARQTTNWERLGWFGLGLAATLTAIWGVKQVVQ